MAAPFILLGFGQFHLGSRAHLGLISPLQGPTAKFRVFPFLPFHGELGASKTKLICEEKKKSHQNLKPRGIRRDLPATKRGRVWLKRTQGVKFRVLRFPSSDGTPRLNSQVNPSSVPKSWGRGAKSFWRLQILGSVNSGLLPRPLSRVKVSFLSHRIFRIHSAQTRLWNKFYLQGWTQNSCAGPESPWAVPNPKILGFGSRAGSGALLSHLLRSPGFSTLAQYNSEVFMLDAEPAVIFPESELRDRNVQHHVVAWEGQVFPPWRDPEDPFWIIQDGICPLGKESGPPTMLVFLGFFKKMG